MNQSLCLASWVAAQAFLGAFAFAAETSAPAKAQTSPAAAETEAAAWKAIQEASRPPLPPSEWNNKKPTDEEYAAFRKQMGTAAAAAADKAKEFAVKYPASERLAEAKEMRISMLQAAVQLGVADRADELKELGGNLAKNESGDQSADPFDKKMRSVMTKAMKLQDQGIEVVLVEFEKGIREVMVEFPDRTEVYGALLQVAEGLGGDKGKAIAKEIAEGKAPPEFKQMAETLQKKFNMLGSPLELQFTALDGRSVNLANLKGKVVLIDFWATWCGPCVAELPKVKAAYEKLNPKGFEIVGISFDEDKDALESFVKKKAMAWPQYFDGNGWQNKFGQQYGITGIPTMWLVDKKGILRDFNAREDLASKVEKMLAEN